MTETTYETNSLSVKYGFYEKLKKALKISSFAGWELGAFLCGVFVPLQILIIGEKNIENFGDHALSLGILGKWVFGFGFATFVVNGVAILSLHTKQTFIKIIVLIAFVAHILFVLIVVVFAAVREDVVDYYGQEMWDNADSNTIDLLENYFICCGYSEKNQDDCTGESASLKLCSENLRAVILESQNGKVVINTPLLLTLIFLILLAIYDLWMIMLVSFWTRYPKKSVKKESFGFEFSDSNLKTSSIYTISRSNSTICTVTTSVTTDQTYSTSNKKKSNNEKTKNPKESLDENLSSTSSSSTNGNENDQNNKSKKYRLKTWLKIILAFVNKIGNGISLSMQKFFYIIGLKAAKHSKLFMTMSIIVGVTLTVSIVQQRKISQGVELLLPEDALLREQIDVVTENFPYYMRENNVIVVSKDVLKTDKIRSMAEFDYKLVNTLDSNNQSYLDYNSAICFPLIGTSNCLRSSLFELWSYEKDTIEGLTKEEVLSKLNESPVIYSPYTNTPFSISNNLGATVRNSNNNVTNATAHFMRYYSWYTKSDWELKFVEVSLNGSEHPNLNEVYVRGAQSETIEFDKTFYADMPRLIYGGFLIFLYILVMTGNWSLVGHRFWVSVASLVSIGLSLGFTIGLSAALLYPWTQLGLLAPFLLLGIGVDDMFVILRTWDNVVSMPENKHKSIEEIAGSALSLAGASITVTSMTDLIAFCIGISSTIPFLSSFCVTLSLGVVTLFIMQVTFFFPALIIDERRKLKKHDGFLLSCYKHKSTYKENKYANMQLQKKFFSKVLSYVATNTIVKVIVLISTFAVTGIMCWGVSNLTYDYDEKWFYDSNSYLSDYFKAEKKYFAENQFVTTINMVDGDFFQNRMMEQDLKKELESNEYIVENSCYGWFDEFISWNSKLGIDVSNDLSFGNSSSTYVRSIDQFLFEHPIFRVDVKINKNYKNLNASRFRCTQKPVDLQSYALPGMRAIRDICSSFQWPGGEVFPLNENYLSLDSILLVQKEIVTNLVLTFVAVTVIIFFLISSLQACFWVIISVLLTIINVAGVTFFWGLTIEAGTMVCLILSIGLAVDYSSHIGYKFMVYKGTKSERAKASLINMGPAVFNGGFSTFLPIIMLAGSNIYVTLTFFKIFVSTVIFGLWNSLVFLPAILSLIGPPPYKLASHPS